MRQINYIVIHCTATQPTATVEAIRNYWRDIMKWKSPGYHYLIEESGKVNILQLIEKLANGVAGHNQNSIHVSYIGGIDKLGKPKDTRSIEQKEAMLKIVKELKIKFPNAKILGHKDFQNVNKACPSFDVFAWVKENRL
jgi:N-acetylmuramoyl-L-alanine amidase